MMVVVVVVVEVVVVAVVVVVVLVVVVVIVVVELVVVAVLLVGAVTIAAVVILVVLVVLAVRRGLRGQHVYRGAQNSASRTNFPPNVAQYVIICSDIQYSCPSPACPSHNRNAAIVN
jgi:hypothetical protein